MFWHAPPLPVDHTRDGFIGPDDPTKCGFTVSVTGDPFRGQESSVKTTEVSLPITQAAALIEQLSSNILKVRHHSLVS